jgi:hypothetical protein
MNHDEMIKVIQAHKEGKQIQFLDSLNEWCDNDSPSWNFHSITYRIKPEPKYRPFTLQEAVAAELEGKRIYDRNTFRVIAGYAKEGVFVGNGDDFITFGDLLNYYVFGNSSPCGVLEEEKYE